MSNASTPSPTVVVTGANDLVGGAVVERALAKGWSVIAATPDARALEGRWRDRSILERIEVRVGSLSDPGFATALVRGADYVVQADLAVDLRADYGKLVGRNVQGPARLYEAAGEAGVRHFVHIGTALVYGVKRALVDEQTPRFGSSPFEQSCIDGENVLMDLSEENQAALTVLRPGFIYGPGGRTALGSIAAAMVTIAQVMPYLPGLVGGPRSNWVHVEDLADAALLVLGNAGARGQYFNVGDERPTAWGDVVTHTTAAVGVPIGALLPWPPQRLVDTVLSFAEQGLVSATLDTFLQKAWELVSRKYDLKPGLAPSLSRGSMAWLHQDMSISSARIRALGYAPRHGSLHGGIEQTIDWYRSAGWLPDTPERATPQPSDGFKVRFQETLTGSATHGPTGEQRAVRVELTVDIPMITVTEGVFFVDGTIDIEGVCQSAPLEGTLTLPSLSRPKLVSQFAFADDEGHTHRFVGSRGAPTTVFEILRAWTRMSFEVVNDSGEPWLNGELSVDLKGLISLLTSPRLDAGS